MPKTTPTPKRGRPRKPVDAPLPAQKIAPSQAPNETKPAPATATTIPPLMSLAMFFRLFNISKSLFYKLSDEQRPRVVRVGCKPMIRAEDALEWVKNLPEASS